MRAHLIHGFNVSDGGVGTVGNLRPFFADAVLYKIGMIGLANLRCKNKKIVDELLPHIGPEDVIVGHSNGALICHRLLQAGARPKAVVLINPALRRDTRFPRDVRVLCLHTKGDFTVLMGRAWSRLVSLGKIRPHGWGAAGYYGITTGQKNVINIDMGGKEWAKVRIRSHSGALKFPAVSHWGKLIARWCRSF